MRQHLVRLAYRTFNDLSAVDGFTVPDQITIRAAMRAYIRADLRFMIWSPTGSERPDPETKFARLTRTTFRRAVEDATAIAMTWSPRYVEHKRTAGRTGAAARTTSAISYTDDDLRLVNYLGAHGLADRAIARRLHGRWSPRTIGTMLDVHPLPRDPHEAFADPTGRRLLDTLG